MDAMYTSGLSSLLILPVPPSPPTREALKTAYGPSVTSTLTALAALKLPQAAVLEIAVPYARPHLLDQARSCLFPEAEDLLAGLYSIICASAAQNAITLDDDGGIDPRIILVTYDELAHVADGADGEQSRPPAPIQGPIVGLDIFARTRRHWNYIFAADGDQGQQVLNRYLKLASLDTPSCPLQSLVRTVPGGPGGLTSPSGVGSAVNNSGASQPTHSTVAVGGTFDHLHAGHKLLLTATALLLQPATDAGQTQRRLIVGITGDDLLKNKKYAAYLKCWQQRQEDVVDFLLTILLFSQHGKEEVETVSMDEATAQGRSVHTRLKGAQVTIECVEIQDAFGPTISDESITALAVSRETRSGGAAVNAKRLGKGWKGLETFEVGVLDASGPDEKAPINQTEEFASKISSTAYRKRKAEAGHGPAR